MKINNRMSKIIGAGVLALLVISSFTSMAIKTFDEKIDSRESSFSENMDSLPYEGRLIVYIVEPVSRWNMYNGQPYHYACVGFAFDDYLSVDYLDTFQDSIVWDGDVTVDNVMVIAAVYNPDIYQAYAYPPYQNPFDAHYVDAGAGAHPGETGYNTVNENFTHTVVVEEGTATWCQFCPAMAEALYGIYQSGNYPYYFVALVDDKLTQAAQRLDEYNLYGFPTAFFDGGYKILVGGEPSQGPYRTRIQQCGQREVHDLNLSLSVTWLGGGDLQIDIGITNYGTTYPPNTPNMPSGSTSGNAGIEYTYTSNTTDPDGGDLFYLFDWGDGTDSGWVGPYNSGEEASASHRWDEEGDYLVKVKAKDRGDRESDWSDPLIVHMDSPEFEIGIKGGIFTISATIKNNCGEAYPDVNWSIAAQGGILKLIDVSSEGGFPILGPGVEVEVQTNETIFGLGKIDITVTVETTAETVQGFVFGPFILVT